MFGTLAEVFVAGDSLLRSLATAGTAWRPRDGGLPKHLGSTGDDVWNRELRM